jgi:hemerythrin
MKETAIDFLFNEIKEHFEFDTELMLSANFAYAIAKVKEKDDMIEFAKTCSDVMATDNYSIEHWFRKLYKYTSNEG